MRKRVGIIYRLWKEGKLDITSTDVKAVYEIADHFDLFGYNIYWKDYILLNKAIRNAFAGNYIEVENCISQLI